MMDQPPSQPVTSFTAAPVDPARGADTAVRAAAIPGMASAASRGMVWMLAQTGVVKAAGLVSQLVLAYFLVPDDWGLVGLASTVMFIAGLIQQGGLRQVLVVRQKSLRLWSGQAVWLSIALGAASALFVAGASPLTAAFFEEPRLIGIMAVLAVGLLADSLLVVPMAAMQAGLRFRDLAVLNTSTSLGLLALQIALAALGLGVYSIVVPRVVVTFASAVLAWKISGVPLPGPVRTSRWKFLLSGSIYVLVGLFFFILATQAVVAGVGKAFDTTAAGLYVFAYNLSYQTVTLVTFQMEGVLFASLSKLANQPGRQTRGFVRATRLLAMVAMPLCMAQAAVAEPVVKLVFKAAWHPAIVLVQIMSVAMAFHAALIPTGSFMQAQGRFRAYAWLGIAYAAIVGGFLAVGLILRDLVALAVLVAAGSALASFMALIVASRGLPGSDPPPVARVATMLLPALAISSVAFGVPAWLVHLSNLPETVPGLILRGVIIGGSGSIACLAAYAVWLQSDLMDILSLLRGLAGRAAQGRAAGPAPTSDLTPTPL